MRTAPSNSTPHPAASWSPPHAPTLQINYDGAIFRETNEVGLRVVVRDSEGRVIASLAERVPLPKTVADVEAAAAQRALLFAKELNLNSIIMEGDSEIITLALQAEEQSLASFGNIIEEVRSYAETFHSFKVSHINRRENSVVHNLIRHARHVSGLVVWIKEVFPYLIFVLLADYD